MCLSRLQRRVPCVTTFLHDIVKWNHRTSTVLVRTSESCLAKQIGVQTGNYSLDYFLCSFHIFTLLLHKIFFNRNKRGQQLSFMSPGCCLLLLEQFPTQACRGVFGRVVTERDAWSLWSVSQQQTVHTSRQRLGVVAHFRTSVHDTVSVVTLSSLVPHQRLTSCTSVSVHTCVQVPKLNIHTHTFTHFSILSPVEALHMRL